VGRGIDFRESAMVEGVWRAAIKAREGKESDKRELARWYGTREEGEQKEQEEKEKRRDEGRTEAGSEGSRERKKILFYFSPSRMQGQCNQNQIYWQVAGGVRGKKKMDGNLWGALRVGCQES
jgi:hypothetical protein